MAKSSRKARIGKPRALGEGTWKKVQVSLPGGGGEEDNHYDSRDLQRHAEKDLEAQPGEDMGFFFGLEVIDGNDYRVEDRDGTRILVVKGKEDATTKSKPDADAASVDCAEPPSRKGESLERPKKKRKKRKTSVDESQENKEVPRESPTTEEETDRKKELRADDASSLAKGKELGVTTDGNGSAIDEAQVTQMQTAWMSQTGGVTLHTAICESLVRQNFWTPTPIQAGCLPAAILGRRNIVGSAPTGSGKTLAFLLPIFQSILEAEERQKNGLDVPDGALQALIVAPSRELARQLVAECEKVVARRVALVVGGLAHVKQKRLLARRPPVVVGTPGRLWEMVGIPRICFCRLEDDAQHSKICICT